MCRQHVWTLLNSFLVATLTLLSARHASAQISPGPLSKPHESLSGPLKCTICHGFGSGTPQLKCLSCHKDIRERIERGAGYHARVVNRAKGNADCARCHTEHYGEDFNIVKWPSTKEDFDHRQTGYPLNGRHARLSCEKCHNLKHLPVAERAAISKKDLSRTFLGLSQACLTCHSDVHNGELGPDCQRCHSVERWKPVNGFDHAQTKFPLTGKHSTVPCAKCHPSQSQALGSMQFKGIDFRECTACHKDPHHGAFHGACQSCHDSASWKTVRPSTSFDHARTKFPLNGKHEGLRCAQCHKTTNFTEPVLHARCLDCHKDAHQGQFATRRDGGDCGGCHNEAGWKPSIYTVASHNASRFRLDGKHSLAPCSKCHKPAGAATDYHPQFALCANCHPDVHAGQFAAKGKKCDDCHTVEDFKRSTFSLSRHQASRFPLTEAHAAIACGECHRPDASLPDHTRRYTYAALGCTGCHRDPHHGRFTKVATAAAGRDLCENCHSLRSWQDQKPFAHETTGYALEGAHRSLVCTDCHRRTKVQGGVDVAFHDTPKNCADCHEDVHGGQFNRASNGLADCASCHTPVRWAAALFDHEKGTTFPLAGAHVRVPCQDCHSQRQEGGGRRVVIYRGTPRRCADCHRSL
jgi:hypothetical protein